MNKRTTKAFDVWLEKVLREKTLHDTKESPVNALRQAFTAGANWKRTSA